MINFSGYTIFMADRKYTQRVQEATDAFELLSDEWREEIYRIAKERDYPDEAADFYTWQTNMDYSAGLVLQSSPNVDIQAAMHLLSRLAQGLAEAEDRLDKLEEKLGES